MIFIISLLFPFSMSRHADVASKNNPRLQMQNGEARDGSIQHLHKKRSHQMMMKQGTNERKISLSSKEQRVGLLSLSLSPFCSLICFLDGSTEGAFLL